jgi:hypothetical protein
MDTTHFETPAETCTSSDYASLHIQLYLIV